MKQNTPTPLTLIQQRNQLKERLDHVPTDHKALHASVRLLRKDVYNKRYSIAVMASQLWPTTPNWERNEDNIGSLIIPLTRSNDVKDIVAENSVLEILEASDLFKEADAVLAPLLKEMDEVDAEIEKLRHELFTERQRNREAIERKVAAKINEADEDPEVAKSRQRIAELQSRFGEVLEPCDVGDHCRAKDPLQILREQAPQFAVTTETAN